MNQLKVSLQQKIIALTACGWSQRRIARELGLDRSTVKRYTPSTPEKPTTNSNPITGSEASKPITSDNPTAGSQPGPSSLCEPHRPFIEQALGQGLSAQRIHQDLRTEHAFAGSYESVKRFVRALALALALPFRRMEREPGEQMQVDFGQGAPVIDESGKRRRPHLFRAVLSHSRKAYSEVVWRQDTETFIRCVENAFQDFGGVTATVVVDNRKVAVLDPDWFEPNSQPQDGRLRPALRHRGRAHRTLPARAQGQSRGRRQICPGQRLQGSHLRFPRCPKLVPLRVGAERRRHPHPRHRAPASRTLFKPNDPPCAPCPIRFFLASPKPGARCTATATSSLNAPTTRCSRSIWPARSGSAASRAWSASSTTGRRRSLCTPASRPVASPPPTRISTNINATASNAAPPTAGPVQIDRALPASAGPRA
ncbi:MAG: IS21 family transposase [Candidatus Synoicihabitans palmerolidicus]|nr:IS21 family transposase [Candidatus Synoicihabitans palmerolidicus]